MKSHPSEKTKATPHNPASAPPGKIALWFCHFFLKYTIRFASLTCISSRSQIKDLDAHLSIPAKNCLHQNPIFLRIRSCRIMRYCLNSVLKAADKRMYTNKREYYRSTEKDRRKRRMAIPDCSHDQSNDSLIGWWNELRSKFQFADLNRAPLRRRYFTGFFAHKQTMNPLLIGSSRNFNE